MAIPLLVNGVPFSFPQQGDVGYAAQVTAWAKALTNGVLQLGGAYTLLSDLDLSTFGVKAPYFTSKTANPAAAGVVRLAKTDAVSFRNNANSADLELQLANLGATNGDNLAFEGTLLTGRPSVIATSSTATSCTGSATTVIPFASVGVDTDSAFNGATGVFTCPAGKGGRYMVNAHLRITVPSATALDLVAQVQVNGASVGTDGLGPTTSDATQIRIVLSVNRLFTLAASDTVKVAVVNGLGTARSLDGDGTQNFLTITGPF